MTHASSAHHQKGHANYERLEFLGDRVLGLAIAEYLFETFPKAPEGVLARRFNSLVKKETCALVAEQIDLGPLIKLGDSEAMGGGRRKPTILADNSSRGAPWRDLSRWRMGAGQDGDPHLLGAACLGSRATADRRQDGVAGMGARRRGDETAALCQD